MKKDIRCKSCGRLLAKEDGNMVEILTSRKEKILILEGKVNFVCATQVFTQKGRVKCGAMTGYQFQQKEVVENVPAETHTIS